MWVNKRFSELNTDFFLYVAKLFTYFIVYSVIPFLSKKKTSKPVPTSRFTLHCNLCPHLKNLLCVLSSLRCKLVDTMWNVNQLVMFSCISAKICNFFSDSDPLWPPIQPKLDLCFLLLVTQNRQWVWEVNRLIFLLSTPHSKSHNSITLPPSCCRVTTDAQEVKWGCPCRSRGV